MRVVIVSDVPPSLPLPDQPNIRAANAVGGGYLSVQSAVGSNCYYLFHAEERRAVLVAFGVTFFGVPVTRIISASAKKHMFDVDAQTNIAGVANAKSVRNWSSRGYPCQSVRQLFTPIQSEVSVTRIVARTDPQHAAAFVRRRRVMGDTLRQCPVTRGVESLRFLGSHDGTSNAVRGQGRVRRFSVARPAQYITDGR